MSPTRRSSAPSTANVLTAAQGSMLWLMGQATGPTSILGRGCTNAYCHQLDRDIFLRSQLSLRRFCTVPECCAGALAGRRQVDDRLVAGGVSAGFGHCPLFACADLFPEQRQSPCEMHGRGDANAASAAPAPVAAVSSAAGVSPIPAVSSAAGASPIPAAP